MCYLQQNFTEFLGPSRSLLSILLRTLGSVTERGHSATWLPMAPTIPFTHGVHAVREILRRSSRRPPPSPSPASSFSKDERADIVALIASVLACGDLIRGTGGFRKVRIARKGIGKKWRSACSGREIVLAAPLFRIWRSAGLPCGTGSRSEEFKVTKQGPMNL